MNAQALESAVFQRLAHFWRLQAALAVIEEYPGHEQLLGFQLHYSGHPGSFELRDYLADESVGDAISGMRGHLEQRSGQDVFLSMISDFERFLVGRLQAKGTNDQGTLGQLQRRVEQKYTVPPYAVSLVDEVRERRNALMHNHGQVAPRWVNAATQAYGVAPHPFLNPTQVGVLPFDGEYLHHSARTLTIYSALVV